MGEATDAGHGDGDGAGLFLGERNQFRQRAHAESWVHRDEHRIFRGKADRQKIARQPDWYIGCNPLRRDEGGERRHEQGIAVGRGFGSGTRGNAAVGAGVIDNHRLLAPKLAQPGGDEARIHVWRGSGRRVGNDGDRFFRVFQALRLREERRRQQPQNGEADPVPICSHGVLRARVPSNNKALIPRFPWPSRGCAKPTRR